MSWLWFIVALILGAAFGAMVTAVILLDNKDIDKKKRWWEE